MAVTSVGAGQAAVFGGGNGEVLGWNGGSITQKPPPARMLAGKTVVVMQLSALLPPLTVLFLPIAVLLIPP